MMANSRGVELHEAARRYCMERHAYWVHKAASASWNDLEGRRIYPRYNLLKALLDEIERLEPTELTSLELAATVLMKASYEANDVFTDAAPGSDQHRVMEEEREAFRQFVVTFPERDLIAEPLFYRRALSPEESKTIWSRVQEEWGATKGTYWYPLTDAQRSDVEAFQAPYFRRGVRDARLRDILDKHGVMRVWELREFREYGPEYEMDLDAVEVYYNGAEGFWCSEKMDWIIYASHESSVAVGSEWLLDQIKAIWLDWKERIWTSPFF